MTRKRSALSSALTPSDIKGPIKWLSSSEGRSEVTKALESAHKTVNDLIEARRVKPEQLRELITL